MALKKCRTTSLKKAAVTLGGRGGLKGGPARAQALSKKRRVEIATQGGKARRKQQVRRGY